MSANRRYRRQIGKITQPAGKVELSAETRRLVAEMQAAHDDEKVGVAEFMAVAMQVWQHLGTLPRDQQLEVAGQVMASTLECTYLGWGEL